MALAPVTLPEWLRPWHTAGAWYLLADAPGMLSSAPATEDEAACAAPVSGQARGDLASGHEEPGQDARAADRPGTFPSGPALPEPSLAPGDWPSAWQGLFAKIAPAPVLWAYRELSLDLSGQGDAVRGTLLRTLIAELSLRKGTSTFWPTAVPVFPRGTPCADSPGFLADRTVFWSGVRALRAKVVLVFGRTGMADLGLDAAQLPLFSQSIASGRLVVHLPDMQHLLAAEPHRAPVVSFLRSVLSPYAAR